MDQQLLIGNALESLTFTSTCGTRFRCTNDCDGGRGLHVHVTIAKGTGRVVYSARTDADAVSSPVFKVWEIPPTTAYPANLANTSAGVTRNNLPTEQSSQKSFECLNYSKRLSLGQNVPSIVTVMFNVINTSREFNEIPYRKN